MNRVQDATWDYRAWLTNDFGMSEGTDFAIHPFSDITNTAVLNIANTNVAWVASYPVNQFDPNLTTESSYAAALYDFAAAGGETDGCQLRSCDP